MEDKEKKAPDKTDKSLGIDENWVDDMKQELEDYIEEQGIYIRQ